MKRAITFLPLLLLLVMVIPFAHAGNASLVQVAIANPPTTSVADLYGNPGMPNQCDPPSPPAPDVLSSMFSSPVVSGHLIIAMITDTNSVHETYTISDTLGNSFTSHVRMTHPDGITDLYEFDAISIASGSDTITVLGGTCSNQGSISISEWISSGVGNTATYSFSPDFVTSPPITIHVTAVTGDIVLGLATQRNGGTNHVASTTPGATLLDHIQYAPEAHLDYVSATTGTNTMTWTDSNAPNSGGEGAIGIQIKAPITPPAPPKGTDIASGAIGAFLLILIAGIVVGRKQMDQETMEAAVGVVIVLGIIFFVLVSVGI